MNKPRLIQTYLIDGTLEGVRICEPSESSVKAILVPRLKLLDAKKRDELTQPALYFLINNDNSKAYIGESENFISRVVDHIKKKDWWDIAVVIVSKDNSLEKSDIKYLESLAVERSFDGSMDMENKTVPSRNTIHEFKLHTLQAILDDSQLLLTSLGYDLLSQPQKLEQVWFCHTKGYTARCVFRGDKFVVLEGSDIGKATAPSWEKSWPKSVQERHDIFMKYGKDNGTYVTLTDNVSFRSPNHAGGFITGRNVNAWTTFVNEDNKTMDEVMRKEK